MIETPDVGSNVTFKGCLTFSALTSEFDPSTLMKMICKKSFILLMVGVVLVLQFADCMAAFSRDQEAMQCCGTSACTQANRSRDCCSTMTSNEIPRLLEKVRVSLDVPVVAVIERAAVHETAISAPLISSSFEPQKYSPPDLYTLHGSLLI